MEISFEDKTDPQQVRSCQLRLEVSLVHGMVHLIQQAADKAQWGLTAVVKPTEAAPLLAPSPPRYSH